MICRCCGHTKTVNLGVYKPYFDYECELFHCPACGCRMAPRDPDIYERLHATPDSTYSRHETIANLTQQAFAANNIKRMRFILKNLGRKYEWIITKLASNNSIHKVLEVGCSKGYLTAYLLMTGYDATGMDISESAVISAKSHFGEHFINSDEMLVGDIQEYDAIVHVGTIGCVENPGEFTRNLIKLLKPGGVLLFNAPDVQACQSEKRMWNRGTTPPDLVTLFNREYWHNQFSDIAFVEFISAPLEGLDDLLSILHRLPGSDSNEEPTSSLFGSRTAYGIKTTGRTPGIIKSIAKRTIAFALKLMVSISHSPSMYVTMVRK